MLVAGVTQQLVTVLQRYLSLFSVSRMAQVVSWRLTRERLTGQVCLVAAVRHCLFACLFVASRVPTLE